MSLTVNMNTMLGETFRQSKQHPYQIVCMNVGKKLLAFYSFLKFCHSL